MKKYQKLLISAFIVIWSFNSCFSQTVQGDFSVQRNQLIFYNIGISAASSALGSLINKKSDEKLFKVALKGFSQGALGGYLRHEGKNLTYKITEKEKLEYA